VIDIKVAIGLFIGVVWRFGIDGDRVLVAIGLLIGDRD
jgi:hypothetical protein